MGCWCLLGVSCCCLVIKSYINESILGHCLLILPVLGLIFAQMMGIILLGPMMLIALIGILAFVDIAIYYLSVKIFQREGILAKQ